MIEELQIFTRTYNNYNLPSLTWRLKDEIYVSGKINLGLNEYVVFDQHHAPSLKKVILFIKSMRRNANVITAFQSKRRTVEIVKADYNQINIYYVQKGKKVLRLRKEGYFDLGLDTMMEEIYNQIESLNWELRNYYCEYFRPLGSIKHNFDFKLGDLVETSNASSIKTYRKGMIYSMEYHSKDKEKYYYISINGKFHSRKYIREELILNEEGR